MIKSVDELLASRERVDFEAKRGRSADGRGELPRNFWESFSAMANTQGGYILLGAQQKNNEDIQLIGIPEPERLCSMLWNGLNNPQQISMNLLREEHVQIVEHQSMRFVLVQVPRAKRLQRPIYIGTNPLTGTYRRNYEGDYLCDPITVRRMLAEATEETRDAGLLDGFTMEDIDEASLTAYRNQFRSAKPGHPWISLSDQELSRNLGGWTKDRDTGNEGPTLAGILMFGRLRSILDAFPHYLVDYQERPSAEQGEIRWFDRVTESP